MSDLTNYGENKLADAWRGQGLPIPANWHVGLLKTVTDGEAQTFVELSGGNYARAVLPATMSAISGTQGAGTTVASSGTGGRISNNAELSFGSPSVDWGGGSQATHLAWFDAATGGQAWVVKALAVPKSINVGDPVKFPADTLAITFG